MLSELEVDEGRVFVPGHYDHGTWTADCRRFVIAKKDAKAFEFWDAEGPARLEVVETGQAIRNGLVLSADGRFIAAAEGTYKDLEGHDTQLEIFEMTEDGGVTRAVAIDPPETILGMWVMAFTPDGTRLLVPSQMDAKSGLRSFAAGDGSMNWRQDGFVSYWVRALAVSPDGDLLATGDEKGWLRLWDLASGEKRHEERTGQVIQALAFSEDGKDLAVALKDSTIGIVSLARLSP